QIHGNDQIIASDVNARGDSIPDTIRFETLDIRESTRLDELIEDHRVEIVYHLAGILSAKGEADPGLC
ncbi:NAD-dependent epimerase/dehydratase family protein, partial [candidate division KSB1 bacterium]|nr:NAD-dependent epimerase/dehydratase family protein [Phycisphaerae bacterium]NIV95747.1 NAD-dependent epimerase/dehydratase family protein [candidate division KSB1 bacterium]